MDSAAGSSSNSRLSALAIARRVIGSPIRGRLLNIFIGGKGRVERTAYIDLKQRRGRWE
jgi:hypothetical protein